MSAKTSPSDLIPPELGSSDGTVPQLQLYYSANKSDTFMITITALKWVPPFAQGQVRDHRVRWILNEVGRPYEVRLLDTEDQQSQEYRAMQPFGQVPVLFEDGRPPLFETGAILWMSPLVQASCYLTTMPNEVWLCAGCLQH